MFHRARRLSPSLHLPKTKNHRNNGAFPRYSLDIFRRAFETGHERAAYALRISRRFLQFHPPATKDRFSDDNPLIHCALHCFSIFPLSLSSSIFQRPRNCYSRILFSSWLTCVRFLSFSNDENAGQLCLEEEKKDVETVGEGAKG